MNLGYVFGSRACVVRLVEGYSLRMDECSKMVDAVCVMRRE